MDFAFSEAQTLLRSVLRDFAAAELAPRYAEWDRSGEFPGELWRAMGTLGVTGARVPEAYGGSALDAVSTGIAAEEIACGDFNLAYGVLMPALVGEVLRQHAGDRVKDEWLPPLASGEAVLGLALSEPGAGSDAKAITTRARRDGDEYVIDGEKSGISLLTAADACVTFAKTDPNAGARGVSAFLVPMKLPGVTRIRFRDMGSHAIGRGALHLDGVRVPADYRIGAEGGRERMTEGARLLQPDVARDGRIVALRGGGGTTVPVVIDAAGGAPRDLVAPSLDVQWAYPRWSPDGTRIAISRWRQGGYYDVVILDAAGRVVAEATNDRAVAAAPAWSPDGRWVLFSSDRTGIANLYAWEVNGGRVMQVTNVLTGAFQPDVSPDGRWIAFQYYRSDGYHVARIPFAPAAWRPAPPVRPQVAPARELPDPERGAAGAPHPVDVR